MDLLGRRWLFESLLKWIIFDKPQVFLGIYIVNMVHELLCDGNLPVVLRSWFEPQLTHERLEISKNSSPLQSEGDLKGMRNCWQSKISMYTDRNNVIIGTLYLLTTDGSVPVAMVNNGPSLVFFYPQSYSACVMTSWPVHVCVTFYLLNLKLICNNNMNTFEAIQYKYKLSVDFYLNKHI